MTVEGAAEDAAARTDIDYCERPDHGGDAGAAGRPHGLYQLGSHYRRHDTEGHEQLAQFGRYHNRDQRSCRKIGCVVEAYR